MTDRSVLSVLLRGWDDAWVPGAWTVRPDGDGWTADRSDSDPDPAPVTTIAWRLWHLASNCLASYLGLDPGSPLAVSGRQWHGDAGTALRDLRTAAAAFRAAAVANGEDGVWAALGPAWGSYADSTWADLVVHAFDELAHHGAEIALLRDLHRAQTASR